MASGIDAAVACRASSPNVAATPVDCAPRCAVPDFGGQSLRTCPARSRPPAQPQYRTLGTSAIRHGAKWSAASSAACRSTRRSGDLTRWNGHALHQCCRASTHPAAKPLRARLQIRHTIQTEHSRRLPRCRRYRRSCGATRSSAHDACRTECRQPSDQVGGGGAAAGSGSPSPPASATAEVDAAHGPGSMAPASPTVAGLPHSATAAARPLSNAPSVARRNAASPSCTAPRRPATARTPGRSSAAAAAADTEPPVQVAPHATQRLQPEVFKSFAHDAPLRRSQFHLPALSKTPLR